VSKSSDKRTLEVELPNSLAEFLVAAPGEDLDSLIEKAHRFLALGERQTEAVLRKWTAIGLWIVGVIVLGVSLFLIVGQAFEWSHLPDMAVTTLIGSVAAEFVAMFYVVVRYLFPHGGRKNG
jgi:hypothetical protein